MSEALSNNPGAVQQRYYYSRNKLKMRKYNREYMRQYYRRKRWKAWYKQYRKDNVEKLRQWGRDSYWSDPEKHRLMNQRNHRKYYFRHRRRVLRRAKIYRENNREEINERRRIARRLAKLKTILVGVCPN